MTALRHANRTTLRPHAPALRRAAWLAGTIWVVVLAATVVSIWLSDHQNGPIVLSPGDLWETVAVSIILVIPYSTIGALILAYRPENHVGWVLLAIGILAAFNTLTSAYGNYSHPVDLQVSATIAGLSEITWLPPLLLAVTLVPLLYPTGHPPGSRWRWLIWTTLLSIALFFFAAFVEGWTQRNAIASGATELPDPQGWFLIVLLVAAMLVIVSMLGSIASMVVRFRHSTGQERDQLKWFVLAIGIVAVILAIQLSFDLSLFVERIFWILSTILPVSIGIAILRYQLLDIDVVISRTLLWALLTAFVAGVYVLIVGFIGSRLASSNDLLLSLIATGIVAVSFQPVRVRLQASINRRIFGDRDDPYAAIARLGRQLERVANPHAMLAAIAESVAQGLRLPYAAITLWEGERFALAAAYGAAVPNSTTLTLPLVSSSEQVGELILAPRTPNERFGPADLRLLEDLARQIGVAAHAAQLTTDLQRSREQLVIAREEERRRIRNDLHDGLGPVLSGLKLRAETARNLVGDNPQVDALLADIAARTESAVTDVRRLVYSLRPPALDDVGLAAALQELGYQAELPVDVTLPATMPPLSAAVEVAVFRITQEALTNVARHADATMARIELQAGETLLTLSISDDGSGLQPDARSGVGLRSMRERAAELGGAMTVDSREDIGTTIRVTFPLTPSSTGGPSDVI